MTSVDGEAAAEPANTANEVPLPSVHLHLLAVGPNFIEHIAELDESPVSVVSVVL